MERRRIEVAKWLRIAATCPHANGLHRCASVAKELGGELSVSSDGPGNGATFTLSIPLRLEDRLNTAGATALQEAEGVPR